MPDAMPAFAERYSKKQKAALFREAIDRARPVAAVLRAARAGQIDGLEPREQAELGAMPSGYACQLVRAEREERQTAQDGPAPPAQQLAAKLMRRAEIDVDRIARNLKGPMNVDDALKLARLIERADAILRPPKPASRQDPPDPKTPRKAVSFAARIAASADTEDPGQPTT